jgi:hypothetical protein
MLWKGSKVERRWTEYMARMRETKNKKKNYSNGKERKTSRERCGGLYENVS